jgi:predicted nucleic acid-binding Zn ribbon protein
MIYEYVCDVCGSREEREFKLKDRPLTMACGRLRMLDPTGCCPGIMKLVPSLSSFHLKGKNWAKDGYSGGQSKEKK